MRLACLALLPFSLALAPSKPHILSVGLAAVDFVAVVDHFPVPDEKMRSSSLIVEGGGNAANTAAAIGRLGIADVSLVTAVGDDANGNTIVEGLKDYFIGTDSIERFEGCSPFSYILTTDIDGDNTRTVVHQPADGDMSIDFVEKLDLEKVTAVHFDLRYPKAAMILAERCAKAGIPYSVDVERPREGLEEILSQATVVICNSNYCDTVLGKDEKETDVAARLRKVVADQAPKAQIAVQTLGSKGSCLIRMGEHDKKTGTILKDKKDKSLPVVEEKKGVLYCSALKGVTVVDTTGAGDSFQGGLISALWASGELPTDTKALGHALRIASRVAGKKVEKPGARQGLPFGDKDEFLKAEIKALKELAPKAATV